MPKPYKYQCPHDNCKSSFNRPYRLEQHLLVHENKKNFVCSEDGCTKSYTNKSHLQRHINTTHKKMSDLMLYYPCLECLKPYSNRQNLKRHMKKKHSNDSKYCLYTCDTCKMDFKKKTHLRAHMYKHTGWKSYSCKLCSQECISAYDRKRHMRFHKNYKCGECHTQFDHWSKYLEHKKSEHSQKEYICDCCQKQFKVRAHILRHMKSHNTVELIQCPYMNCTRSYTKKTNLKQHINMFHMNIKYDCHICEVKLSTKGKLKQHLKRHEEPLPVKSIRKGNQRNLRWDKGLLRASTAIKLAGLPQGLVNQGEIKISVHDGLTENFI